MADVTSMCIFLVLILSELSDWQRAFLVVALFSSFFPNRAGKSVSQVKANRTTERTPNPSLWNT